MGQAVHEVEFVLIAEAGALERQALMLCESIRQFGGVLSASPITVVSPRKSRRPSTTTLKKLENLQAEFLPLEIDTACPDYGPSFRVHAVAHAARRPGPAVLVQIDSDTLFVDEPILLKNFGSAIARPVDVKGMCTTGRNDEFDQHWKTLCSVADVDYDRLPFVDTTVDGISVRASYNGGLIAARRTDGIFERTEEFFERFMSARLQPWGKGFVIRSGVGIVSAEGSAYWGTTQAAFSLAAVAGGHTVELLPATYNFPLHLLDAMTKPVPFPLVHIHYHWLDDGSGALLDERLGLSEEVREWLRSRMPLQT